MAGLFAWGLGCGGDDDDDATTDDGGGDTSPDDDSSGDATDDGGDADTTLDQLTDDEAQAFCEDVLGSSRRTTSSSSAAPSPASGCTRTTWMPATAVQDCIDAEESPAPVAEPVCVVDPTDVPALPDCAGDITVGELRGCLEAFFDEFRVVLDSVTCETSLDEVPPFPAELPEECAALQAECPELFGPPE